MIAYLLYTGFTLLFIFYQKYQFNDTRGVDVIKAKKMWHGLGLALRLSGFLLLLIPTIFPLVITFQDILLIGSLNALIWELGINKIALNVDWLHLGVTAASDKKFGKWKWVIIGTLLIISIFIKIFI